MNTTYKNFKFFVDRIVVTTLLFLFSLFFFIYTTFLLTPIYSLSIKIFNIDKYSNHNFKELLLNYRTIITYIFSPIMKDLKLPDFTLSYRASYHFKEVKLLFFKMIIFMIIIFILLIYYFVTINKNNKLIFFKYLNYLSNISISFFIITILLLKFDFWNTFTSFHKFLFKNNYWLLNPKIDPIINILPKEFFMLCGIFICVLFFVQFLFIKISKKHYYKNSFKKLPIFN